MSKFRKPKCPETLKNTSFDTETRAAIEIPDYLFLSNFDKWNIEILVNDYFSNSKIPFDSGYELYSEIIYYLEICIKSRKYGTKTEKTFVNKFLTYFDQLVNKRLLLKQYQTLERRYRLNESIIEMKEEVKLLRIYL